MQEERSKSRPLSPSSREGPSSEEAIFPILMAVGKMTKELKLDSWFMTLLELTFDIFLTVFAMVLSLARLV